jgi:hypothetical protein
LSEDELELLVEDEDEELVEELDEEELPLDCDTDD